jgi:hypothetical protein
LGSSGATAIQHQYQKLLSDKGILTDSPTDVDNVFVYVNSFLSGFKATTMFPNIQKCVNNIQASANAWNVTV